MNYKFFYCKIQFFAFKKSLKITRVSFRTLNNVDAEGSLPFDKQMKQREGE